MFTIRSNNLLKQIRRNIILRQVTSTNIQDWNIVLEKAEKVIGYPTSFLNLRWILNDQVANFASHLMKLLKTNHPLVEIGRNFLIQNQSPYGLVILLMSKMAGQQPKLNYDHTVKGVGILHKQRIVAEVSEMLHTSNQMHTGIIKVESQKNDEEKSSLLYGNLVALLSGDFLLAKSYNNIAEMRNSDANLIISTSLRDLAEYEFLGPWDENNHPLPSRPVKNKEVTDIFEDNNCNQGPYEVDKILGNPRDEWVLRNILYRGNLLAKCCMVAMVFSEQSLERQNQAYLFGKNFILAQRASDQYKEFVAGNEKFSLIGAPVMLQLHHDDSLYSEIEKGMKSIDHCDYKKIRAIIEEGKGLENTRALIDLLVKRAFDNLEHFENNESKLMLKNMVSLLRV